MKNIDELDVFVECLCRQYRGTPRPVYKLVILDVQTTYVDELPSVYEWKYVAYLVIKEIDGLETANDYIGEDAFNGALRHVAQLDNMKYPTINYRAAENYVRQLKKLFNPRCLYYNPVDNSFYASVYISDDNLVYRIEFGEPTAALVRQACNNHLRKLHASLRVVNRI